MQTSTLFASRPCHKQVVSQCFSIEKIWCIGVSCGLTIADWFASLVILVLMFRSSSHIGTHDGIHGYRTEFFFGAYWFGNLLQTATPCSRTKTANGVVLTIDEGEDCSVHTPFCTLAIYLHWRFIQGWLIQTSKYRTWCAELSWDLRNRQPPQFLVFRFSALVKTRLHVAPLV